MWPLAIHLFGVNLCVIGCSDDCTVTTAALLQSPCPIPSLDNAALPTQSLDGMALLAESFDGAVVLTLEASALSHGSGSVSQTPLLQLL